MLRQQKPRPLVARKLRFWQGAARTEGDGTLAEQNQSIAYSRRFAGNSRMPVAQSRTTNAPKHLRKLYRCKLSRSIQTSPLRRHPMHTIGADNAYGTSISVKSDKSAAVGVCGLLDETKSQSIRLITCEPQRNTKCPPYYLAEVGQVVRTPGQRPVSSPSIPKAFGFYRDVRKTLYLHSQGLIFDSLICVKWRCARRAPSADRYIWVRPRLGKLLGACNQSPRNSSLS